MTSRPKSARLVLVLAVGLALGCAAGPGSPAPAAAPTAAPPPGGESELLRSAGIDPAAIRCNPESRYGTFLKGDALAATDDIFDALGPGVAPDAAQRRKVESIVFWRMVRAILIDGNNNNFGVVPLRGYGWRDADGVERPVLLFRSGFTPRPGETGSCFQSLLDNGDVRHVTNLFDGDIPAADLVEAEKRAATSSGASYFSATDDPEAGYGPWRDTLRKHYDEPEKRAEAARAVARLIRERILRPDGAAPRGNVHIHCGGGMHRTGMVVGVVERCVNGSPLELVEAHYRRHVGYQDEANPGGFEEGNLRFIREFDCGLLER